MFCMFPDSKSEWKKWATGQSFIQKEITSYRISTLERFFLNFWHQKNVKKITLLDSSAASIIDGLLQLDMESSAGLVWIVTSLVAALLGEFI